MRAVRSTGEGVEVVDVDEPEGPGELLTMRTASICGSDLGYIAMGSRFVLGHELAGVTEDGRWVAVEGVRLHEAAGSPSALARAVDLAAPGGCVVLIGVHTSGFEPPFLPLLLKEVRLVPAIAYGRHAHGHDMAEAAAMLAADPEVAATLVTHRFPLEESSSAFAAAADRAAGAIKVVIDIQ